MRVGLNCFPPRDPWGVTGGWHHNMTLPQPPLRWALFGGILLSLLRRCVNPPRPNKIIFLVNAPTLCYWSYGITVESILLFIPLYWGLPFIPLFSPPQNRVSYGSVTPLHTRVVSIWYFWSVFGWYFLVFTKLMPEENLVGTFWNYFFGGNPFFPWKGGHGPLFEGPSPHFEEKRVSPKP